MRDDVPKPRSRRWCLPLLTTLLGSYPFTLGIAASDPPVADGLPDVTVEAQRRSIEKRVDRFVTKLTHALPESLSRWNVPICPLVGGVPKATGEFMLARLSATIRDIGAPLADETCEPNLYILFSTDPQTLLRSWRKRDPRLFGEGYELVIRRFITGNEPVRVWHNITHESPTAGLTATDSPAANLPTAFQGARLTQSYSATRLLYKEVRGFSNAIVIVDPRTLEGLSVATLSDYIAMTALTELDTSTRIDGVPSVLRLFTQNADAPPAGLSAWDRAFLRGLYHSDQRETMQRSVIESAMLRAIASLDEPPTGGASEASDAPR